MFCPNGKFHSFYHFLVVFIFEVTSNLVVVFMVYYWYTIQRSHKYARGLYYIYNSPKSKVMSDISNVNKTSQIASWNRQTDKQMNMAPPLYA